MALSYIERNPADGVAKTCVIWLHGLGASGHDFEPVVEQLDLPPHWGVRFILPHAPVRPVTLNGGLPMPAWYDLCDLGSLSQEDAAGIQHSETQLQALIEQQINDGIAADRIVLAGFSQGGALALYVGVRYAQRLAALIGLSTYLPLADQLAEGVHLANAKLPVFIAHGELDDVVPLSAGQATFAWLQRHEYASKWHSYPMEHRVCAEEIADIRRFLSEVL